jgi:hypothetical protein
MIWQFLTNQNATYLYGNLGVFQIVAFSIDFMYVLTLTTVYRFTLIMEEKYIFAPIMLLLMMMLSLLSENFNIGYVLLNF